MEKIDTLFLDVGGVLLTNGWDHTMRQAAAEHFGFDYDSYEERHKLVYSAHELGHMSLEKYLKFALFYTERPFTMEDFLAYMRAQSQPHQEMIAYLHALKAEKGLRLVALSNEGRELMLHRINTCGLKDLLDFFIVSAFVGFRKPDPTIYYKALDLVQRPPEQTVYVDDRAPLIEVAKSLGIRAIHHASLEKTQAEVSSLFV